MNNEIEEVVFTKLQTKDHNDKFASDKIQSIKGEQWFSGSNILCFIICVLLMILQCSCILLRIIFVLSLFNDKKMNTEISMLVKVCMLLSPDITLIDELFNVGIEDITDIGEMLCLITLFSLSAIPVFIVTHFFILEASILVWLGILCGGFSFVVLVIYVAKKSNYKSKRATRNIRRVIIFTCVVFLVAFIYGEIMNFSSYNCFIVTLYLCRVGYMLAKGIKSAGYDNYSSHTLCLLLGKFIFLEILLPIIKLSLSYHQTEKITVGNGA